MRSPVPVFVIDGHDIELYPDAASAAVEIEGYDAHDMVILGADGTVYEAIVQGPEWGPVDLRDTGQNARAALLRLLYAEAAARSVPLLPDLPEQPTAIWKAITDAQITQRSHNQRWRKPDH